MSRDPEVERQLLCAAQEALWELLSRGPLLESIESELQRALCREAEAALREAGAAEAAGGGSGGAAAGGEAGPGGRGGAAAGAAEEQRRRGQRRQEEQEQQQQQGQR